MDEYNLKILNMLQNSGRISHSEISSVIGLSVPAITCRIKKLEKEGIIAGYYTKIDAKKMGKDVTAFINVKINHPKVYTSFVNSISKIEEVQECHHIIGEFDYLLKVKTENTSTLEYLISNKIRALPGVSRTLTTVVLSSIKEDSTITI